MIHRINTLFFSDDTKPIRSAAINFEFIITLER